MDFQHMFQHIVLQEVPNFNFNGTLNNQFKSSLKHRLLKEHSTSKFKGTHNIKSSSTIQHFVFKEITKSILIGIRKFESFITIQILNIKVQLSKLRELEPHLGFIAFESKIFKKERGGFLYLLKF